MYIILQPEHLIEKQQDGQKHHDWRNMKQLLPKDLLIHSRKLRKSEIEKEIMDTIKGKKLPPSPPELSPPWMSPPWTGGTTTISNPYSTITTTNLPTGTIFYDNPMGYTTGSITYTTTA